MWIKCQTIHQLDKFLVQYFAILVKTNILLDLKHLPTSKVKNAAITFIELTQLWIKNSLGVNILTLITKIFKI